MGSIYFENFSRAVSPSSIYDTDMWRTSNYVAPIVRQWDMAKTTITAAVTKKPAFKKGAAVKTVASASVKVVAAVAAKPARKTNYGALVRRLAKDYGVKVAAAPTASSANPYSVSEAVTKKALQSVGILNRQGKLAAHLK